MKYFIILYIGQDQYTYNQTIHDYKRRNTIEECMTFTRGLNDHFQAKNITCWSYQLHEHNPDTGDIRVIESNFYNHPLKTRVEINKEAKDAPRKAVMPDADGLRWVGAGLRGTTFTMDDANAVVTATARPRVRNPAAIANEVIERERAIRRERDRIAVNELVRNGI